MAIIRNSKIREMAEAEMQAKLFEFQRELNSERGLLAAGGRTSNPGKLRELRRSVARMLTIMHERKLGIRRHGAKGVAAPMAKEAAIAGTAEKKQ